MSFRTPRPPEETNWYLFIGGPLAGLKTEMRCGTTHYVHEEPAQHNPVAYVDARPTISPHVEMRRTVYKYIEFSAHDDQCGGSEFYLMIPEKWSGASAMRDILRVYEEATKRGIK